MKKQILGAAMSLAAAVSMSLLAVPSATAVDDPLDDTLAVSTTVEEATEDATPEAGDEALLSEDSGISVRQYSGCPLGYACVWEKKGYRGYPYMQAVNHSPVSSRLDDKSSSAAANGKDCQATMFFDLRTDDGDYFLLDSQTRKGYNYQDPNLSNGAGLGYAADQDWNHRISYIKFVQCD